MLNARISPRQNLWSNMCRLLKAHKKKTIFAAWGLVCDGIYANFLHSHKKHYPSWQYSMFKPFNQFDELARVPSYFAYICITPHQPHISHPCLYACMVLLPHHHNHHMPPSIGKQIKKNLFATKPNPLARANSAMSVKVDGGVYYPIPCRIYPYGMEIFVGDFRLCNPVRITI